MNFESFKTTGQNARYYRVPIALLDDFRSEFPAMFRIRYRGPRYNIPSAATRWHGSKQSSCLKQDAIYFSAYSY
jgi:hypothetical protein